MIQNYDREAMTSLWLRTTRREPLRADCVTLRTDSVDLRAIAQQEMRQWYLELLRKGDLELVDVQDLKAGASLELLAEGEVRLTVPEGVQRVVAVELEGWQRPARLIGLDDSRLSRRQALLYARGGVAEPVAVDCGWGEWRLYSAPSATQTPQLRRLMAVADTGPDLYRFDEAALSVTPLSE